MCDVNVYSCLEARAPSVSVPHDLGIERRTGVTQTVACKHTHSMYDNTPLLDLMVSLRLRADTLAGGHLAPVELRQELRAAVHGFVPTHD